MSDAPANMADLQIVQDYTYAFAVICADLVATYDDDLDVAAETERLQLAALECIRAHPLAGL